MSSISKCFEAPLGEAGRFPACFLQLLVDMSPLTLREFGVQHPMFPTPSDATTRAAAIVSRLHGGWRTGGRKRVLESSIRSEAEGKRNQGP